MSEYIFSSFEELQEAIDSEVNLTWPEGLSYRPFYDGRAFLVVQDGERVQSIQIWLRQNENSVWEPAVLLDEQAQELVNSYKQEIERRIPLSRKTQETPALCGWFDANGQVNGNLPTLQAFWTVNVPVLLPETLQGKAPKVIDPNGQWVGSTPEMFDDTGVLRTGYSLLLELADENTDTPELVQLPADSFLERFGFEYRAFGVADFDLVRIDTGAVVPLEANGFYSADVFDPQTGIVNSSYAFRPKGDAYGLQVDDHGYLDRGAIKIGAAWYYVSEEQHKQIRVDPNRSGLLYTYEKQDPIPLDTPDTQFLLNASVSLDKALLVKSDSVEKPAFFTVVDSLDKGILRPINQHADGSSVQDEGGDKDPAPDVAPNINELGPVELEFDDFYLKSPDGIDLPESPRPTGYLHVPDDVFEARLDDYKSDDRLPDGYDRRYIFMSLDYAISIVPLIGAQGIDNIVQIVELYPAYKDIVSDYVARRIFSQDLDIWNYISCFERRLMGQEVEVTPMSLDEITEGLSENAELRFFRSLLLEAHNSNYDKALNHAASSQSGRSQLEKFHHGFHDFSDAERQKFLVSAIERHPEYKSIFIEYWYARQSKDVSEVDITVFLQQFLLDQELSCVEYKEDEALPIDGVAEDRAEGDEGVAQENLVEGEAPIVSPINMPPFQGPNLSEHAELSEFMAYWRERGFHTEDALRNLSIAEGVDIAVVQGQALAELEAVFDALLAQPDMTMFDKHARFVQASESNPYYAETFILFAYISFSNLQFQKETYQAHIRKRSQGLLQAGSIQKDSAFSEESAR